MTEQEFDAFVRTNATSLLRTAYLLVGDDDAAHDVLQVALTRCWRHRARLADADAPTAYARRIVTNVASSWWRSRLSRREVLVMEVPDRRAEAESPDDDSALWQAIRDLPRGQRAVVVLRYYEDLTEAETAHVLGCSVGSVKKQAHRALGKLRIAVDKEPGHDDPALARGSSPANASGAG